MRTFGTGVPAVGAGAMGMAFADALGTQAGVG